MTVLLFCIAVILVAIVSRVSRVPIKHRWHQQQARVMRQALGCRDLAQPPALIYVRLREMDALSFEELLLESFERPGHRVVRNHRCTGDGGIDGQVVIRGRVWLIQATRYGPAIRPEHVHAFAALCADREASVLLIHTGRIDRASREVVARHGAIEIVLGQPLFAVVTVAPRAIGGREL